MINLDDLDPARPPTKLRDLQTLSIDELQEYINLLDQEIERVEAMIAKKKAHKSGIDALFGVSHDSES